MTKLMNPADETEPRIMLQILYNLLRHVEDKEADAEGIDFRSISFVELDAYASGAAKKRVRHIKRLAKVYVKKTGGIVH